MGDHEGRNNKERPGQYSQFPVPHSGNQGSPASQFSQGSYNFPTPQSSHGSSYISHPNVPLMPTPGGFRPEQNFTSFPTPNNNSGGGFNMPTPNFPQSSSSGNVPFPMLNSQHGGYNNSPVNNYNSTNSDQSFDQGNSQQDQSPGNYFGPMLRFVDVDLQSQFYHASVLIVAKDEATNNCPPILFLDEPGRPTQNISPTKLDQYKHHGFWRYLLAMRVENQQKKIEYKVGRNGKKFSFYIQGNDEPWRWTFFSCNGFSNDVTPEKAAASGGADPLWNDLMSKHESSPFHAMVGGGDQLYCDDVFLTPALKSWLDIVSRKERDSAAFTEYVEIQVMEYYFQTYCQWFSQGTFANALGSIPYAMVTDDHDIFDGFGSYPERMMNSAFFQGIFKCAMRFFLLFQAHTTTGQAHQDGYFGEKSYSWLKKFGPHTAVAGIDNRSERSIHRLFNPGSYDILFNKLYNDIPPSCKHLMVILGIPIVYPRLSEVESAMGGLSFVQHKLNIHKLFHKTGAFAQLVNQFGQPELLDDLCDHWTAKDHMEERLEFVRKLQGFARDRSIRITFLAGDVHLGAAGYFCSADPRATLLTDHRHMTQIVSSAIVNLPPPDMVVTMLHKTACRYELDNYTIEDMYPLFRHDVDGKDRQGSNKCFNRRNWCGVYQNGSNHEVKFVLFVENKEHTGSVPYEITVCPLQSNR